MSDIHSNTFALDACLKHASDHGADQLAFLGDLVGYGADPAGVVDRVMSLVSNGVNGETGANGAWLVKGNHDAMAVRPPSLIQDTGSSSAAWTHEQLSAEQLDFLDQAPLTVTHGCLLLTHASARHPDKWDYVDSEVKAQLCLDAALSTHQANQVFVGHVHHQFLYYTGANRKLMRFTPTPGIALPAPSRRDMVVTIGSVGQPRDKDTRSMYALYDTEAQKLCFYRVLYDHHAAAKAVRQAGLPEHLAHRLETGT